jgi:hypothetical protein
MAVNASLSKHRRLRPALLAAAVALVGLVVMSFALGGSDLPEGVDRDTESRQHEPPPVDAAESPTPPEAGSPPPPPEDNDALTDDEAGSPLPPLPDSNDPTVYAAAVADVLFGMNHASYEPGDYEAYFQAALWTEIVPDDRTRIMATISRRIPTAEMWEQMRSVEQTAEFDVELVWEPRTARTHRDRGDWPDGWEMRTVSGTQTEAWRSPDEDTQTSTRPVAVTVAMACPPAATPCRLIGILPHAES